MVSNAADILHTVGPVDSSEHKLRNCYTTCLQLTLENKIQSVVSVVHSYPYPSCPARGLGTRLVVPSYPDPSCPARDLGTRLVVHMRTLLEFSLQCLAVTAGILLHCNGCLW